MVEANIDDVLNTLGFGKMQFLILFGCAAQQMYVTNEQMGIGIISIAATCELQVNAHKMAWLMTAAFIAQVGSTHYMGFKSDEIGRRKLMLISSTLTMLMSFISSLMPEFWSFLIMRFIMSCFITGPGLTVLTLLSEFTSIKLRPAVNNVLGYAVGLSMIYVPLMAMWLLPLNLRLPIFGDYYYTSWRALMIFNLLPGIISCTLIYFLPESPKYYLSINEDEKAYAVLEKMCRYNKGKDVTLKSLGFESVSQPRIRGDSILERPRCFVNRMWYETKPLLKGIYLRQMMLIIAILFILFGIGFGLSVWMPRLLKMLSDIPEPMVLCNLVEASESRNESVTFPCGVTSRTLTFNIFFGGSVLLMFMLCSLFLMCIKRKIILLALTLSATFAGFLLNFVSVKFLVVLTFVFLAVPPLCSLRLVITVLVDLIPTHLRSKAVALAMTFGRIGMASTSLFVGYTLNWNCYFTFNTYVVLILLCFWLILMLPSEKKIREFASR